MNKLIIISGATRGLGLAITQQCLKEEYNVVAIGRMVTSNLKNVMESSNQSVFFEAFDFTNIEQIKDLTKYIVNKYGRPYGLVNNAAIGLDGILATMHDTEIEKLVKVNIEAPILFTKYIIRGMLINRNGRIVNVSSIIAKTGFNGLSVYAATKSALIGFTKSLAREVGKANITVNAIAPGFMETDMTTQLDEDKLKSIRRRSPMGNLVNTVDVANGVIYLLSEKSGKITGITLTIDAGSIA